MARGIANTIGDTPGLQDFVQVSEIAAPFNTITNRALIPDLANDLGVLLGIDRILTQQLIDLPEEFGPAGERVFGVLGDTKNMIRLVGPWVNVSGSSGSILNAIGPAYIEVTFYGTGLNLLGLYSATARDIRVTVDGGSEGSNIIPNSASPLNIRGYAPNSIFAIASGLALGLHTIKIRNAAAANDIYCLGFEVLNEAATLKANPGIAQVNGKGLILATQQSPAYGSTFESGALSTRGGRVITYLKSDGTIGKAVTPTNPAQANLTLADHTNEAIIRVINFREFGSNRGDDFSSITGASSNRAFTLGDGTTTLVGSSVGLVNSTFEGVQISNGATLSLIHTFVGTGLDILVIPNDATVRSMTVSIDGGASVGTLTATANMNATIMKVVSGLPYGTHTVKFTNTSGVNTSPGIKQFIVYGQKKPALPANAVELADYNVMADYSGASITGTAVADWMQMPVGVLQKMGTRELVYIGANWGITGSVNTAVPGGFDLNTSTNNAQPFKYTFFGTGFVLNMEASAAATYDFSVAIDGSLNATGVARSNASNLGGGSYRSTSTTGDAPCRIEFTGLTLGVHTISVERTSGGVGVFKTNSLHIITPIHSYKFNKQALQNTGLIGSQGISDSRKFSAIDVDDGVMNWVQAVGISSSPSTTSTTPVPMPDMSVVIETSGRPIEISYVFQGSHSAAGNNIACSLYVDGLQVGTIKVISSPSASYTAVVSDSIVVPVSGGTHKVDVYWNTNAGTLSASNTQRNLTVKELK
jgi:hypothetical protein